MRAARLHAYGGVEHFRIDEVPRPEPRPRDLLIEVHATSVNPVDTKMRRGAHRWLVPRPFPRILGLDVSGVVVAKGARVRGFALGDEVYASPTPWRPGTYAEFVAVDASIVAHKPRSIGHREAASLPLVGLTAWQGLLEHGRLRAGQQVFIQAGSGGVGTVAIQLAKQHGALVATTCSERNAELVRSLGADRAIDHRSTAFEEVLHDQDLVLESLGMETRWRSLKTLRRGGRLVSIVADLVPYMERFGSLLGPVASSVALARFALEARVRAGVKTVVMTRSPNAEQLREMARLVDAGLLRATVDRVLPLEAIAEAHAYSETGRARGKIVIDLRS
jgi:alcohol dehydrogenase